MCVYSCVLIFEYCCCDFCLFFFKQKTAYEMRISDWSSDVCSSDLLYRFADRQPADVGGDARAAGVCAGAELWHQQALDRRRTGAVLGLCRGDGPVDVDDLPEIGRAHV